MRAALFACLLAAISLPAAAVAQERLGDYPDTVITQPLTSAENDRRLDEAAADFKAAYPPGATSSRFAQMDLAWPSSAIENAQLGGHGILLVTAVSRTAAELPLARVFVRDADGRETDLVSLVSLADELPQSPTSDFFGRHRQRAFMLIPLDQFTTGGGGVFLDFATGRKDFRLADTYDGPPEFWTHPVLPATQAEPAAAQAILAREYVGFQPAAGQR